MKDPTSEIKTGVITLLNGNLSYGGNNYPVSTSKPKSKKYRYVLINNVSMVDASTGNSSHTETEFDTEIVSGGYLHNPNSDAVDSISNSIMQLLAYKTVTMTNFTQSIRPYLINSAELEEETDKDIIKRKILTFRMGTNEN